VCFIGTSAAEVENPLQAQESRWQTCRVAGASQVPPGARFKRIQSSLHFTPVYARCCAVLSRPQKVVRGMLQAAVGRRTRYASKEPASDAPYPPSRWCRRSAAAPRQRAAPARLFMWAAAMRRHNATSRVLQWQAGACRGACRNAGHGTRQQRAGARRAATARAGGRAVQGGHASRVGRGARQWQKKAGAGRWAGGEAR